MRPIHYRYPDQFSDITFEGSSVADLLPLEAMVWPDSGTGWVLTKKLTSTDEVNVWIDGQTQLFTLRGHVEVIP